MATAYPGGLRKRGGLLDEFMAPDYSYLARRADATPAQNTRGFVDYLRDEYPRIYGAGAGLLQSDPYETANAYGVFDPNRKAAFEAAQLAFPVGLALDVIPGVGALKRPVMAVGRAGERLAERVVPQVMERGGLLSEMVGAMGNRTISPLDVYHGSPHIFPPTPRNPLGEFDASKIGTGEGAQAYGHGIYTSEAPSVAKSYQSSVSAMHKAQGKSTADVTIQGNPIDWDNPVQVAAFELKRHNGDRAAAAAFHAKTFAGGENNAAVKILKSKQKLPSVDLPGNLYKVDLPDEKIAKMLDWDKPLNEQPNILKVLEKNYRSDYLDMFKNRPGSDFYKAISGNEGVEDLRALGSSELTNLGIPGIKYLDAGSRNVAGGTRNFVVFPGEEKSLTILERNAQKAEELKRLQAGGLLAP
jgi:hypothetical protein